MNHLLLMYYIEYSNVICLTLTFMMQGFAWVAAYRITYLFPQRCALYLTTCEHSMANECAFWVLLAYTSHSGFYGVLPAGKMCELLVANSEVQWSDALLIHFAPRAVLPFY